MSRRHDRPGERGFVLVVVLFFSLLLMGSVATFVRRASVDSLISRNRETSSQAEALARGGVHVATALILEDRLREASGEAAIDSHHDLWSLAENVEVPVAPGVTLRVRIRDPGSLLNINALVNAAQDANHLERSRLYTQALLEKVIDDLGIPPGENLYDPAELAYNLLDFMDADSVRVRGGDEDTWYQQQEPPYRAVNRPLLSPQELRLVEGFDARLAGALERSVTVYPFNGSEGINLNTAPPHVLALLSRQDLADVRLVDEETVTRILEARKDDGVICPQSAEGCTPISEIVGLEGSFFPPPSFTTDVFLVQSSAQIGEVSRVVEAVVSRRDPQAPALLSWRMR